MEFLSDMIDQGAAVQQVLVFSVIALTFVLFFWNGLRYDVVALIAFLTVLLLGLIDAEEAFLSFSHPVIIVVVSMFILSKAITDSGIVEVMTRSIAFLKDHLIFQLFILTALTAFISAFINNIGALAIMIPIAIHMARRSNISPSLYLIPLAFGSHLGGFLTLIGTPRNIIVSSFRERAVGEHFAMFDFAYVGAGVAALGIIFLSVVAWRLLPRSVSPQEAFDVSNYVTEIRIPEGSVLEEEMIKDLPERTKLPITVLALLRGTAEISELSGFERLHADDRLLIQSNSETLSELVEGFKLELPGEHSVEKGITPTDERLSLEAIVTPRSTIIGNTWKEIPLKQRFGVNLLAIARHGDPIQGQLSETRLQTGDILLLHGRHQSVEETISHINCYPLQERPLLLGRTLSIPLTLLIFIATILTATFSSAPIEVVFLTGAVITLVLGLVPIKQAYKAIEWPVVIMIGSMISLGFALENSGGAETASTALKAFSDVAHPALLIGAVLLVSMFLSDVISATASAVIMAPIAIALAFSLGVSVDPFLIAVAIGAASAFVSPVGHESNALVIEAGGYSPKDYAKVGIPLEILVLVVSVPLILYFWPL